MISGKIKKLNIRTVILYAGLLMLVSAGIVFAASGGNGDHGAKGWIAEDTYRVLNFIALALILFFVLKKPVKQFLGDRVRNIREELDDLEAQKQATEKKLAEYNERLAVLGQEAEKIIDQYRKQGESLKEKILQEAESAAGKLEDQARRNIEREFAQAKLHLETEVLEKAIEKAENKLKQITTPEDQEQLVKEYLTKVVTK